MRWVQRNTAIDNFHRYWAMEGRKEILLWWHGYIMSKMPWRRHGVCTPKHLPLNIVWENTAAHCVVGPGSTKSFVRGLLWQRPSVWEGLLDPLWSIFLHHCLRTRAAWCSIRAILTSLLKIPTNGDVCQERDLQHERGNGFESGNPRNSVIFQRATISHGFSNRPQSPCFSL